MRIKLQRISFENMLDILFILIIAGLVVLWIRDVCKSRRKKEDPWAINEEDRDDDPIELFHKRTYWTCQSCDAEFHLPAGEDPHTCPSCGSRLIEAPAGVCDDASAYICSHCGPFILFDGDDAECCPACGGEDIEEVGLALKHTGRWICTDCSQEFTSPGIPRKCPHCEVSFVGDGREIRD